MGVKSLQENGAAGPTKIKSSRSLILEPKQGFLSVLNAFVVLLLFLIKN